MGLLAACLFIALTGAVACNIPEIRFTLERPQARPVMATAAYLTTTALAYGMSTWLLIMLVIEGLSLVPLR